MNIKIINHNADLDNVWEIFWVDNNEELKNYFNSWSNLKDFKYLNFKWLLNFWDRDSLMVKARQSEFNDIIFDNKKISLLEFYNCTFNKDIIFDNFYFKWDIIFENCRFEKNLEFNYCDFEWWELKIIDCNIEKKIKIIRLKKLNYIKIWWYDKNKKLDIEIEKLRFNKNDDDSYLFYWESIKRIYFNHCLNLSDSLKFGSLKDVDLVFDDVDLWKTTFNWVKINKLYLENATLNDCIFNWVEFPKNYKLENYYFWTNDILLVNLMKYRDKEKIEKLKLSSKQMKDNYRQLKFVMDKNWNYAEGNKFFEKEMDYFERELSEKWLSQEKIILFFQKWISYYWKSWILPILWIFLLAFLTDFINYSYLINFYDCETFEFWKLFLNLLYPLYWFRKDYIDSLDNWLLFWFMTYKLIYWILLWHLIVALKRTTKR